MRMSDACWKGIIRFAAFAAAVNGVLGNPILVYDFDETGTNAPSAGTDTTPLYLYATNGVCADLHGGPGSGTTGQPGDRCLDLGAAAARPVARLARLGTDGVRAELGRGSQAWNATVTVAPRDIALLTLE